MGGISLWQYLLLPEFGNSTILFIAGIIQAAFLHYKMKFSKSKIIAYLIICTLITSSVLVNGPVLTSFIPHLPAPFFNLTIVVLAAIFYPATVYVLNKSMSPEFDLLLRLPPVVTYLFFVVLIVIGALTKGSIFFFFTIFIGWMYFTARRLQFFLPSNVHYSTKWFTLTQILAFAYTFVSDLFFTQIMPYAIPLHIFSMYAMFYCVYFLARVIVSAEKQEPVKFDELIVTIVLLWFFPIGLYFIAKRIRNVVTKTGVLNYASNM